MSIARNIYIVLGKSSLETYISLLKFHRWKRIISMHCKLHRKKCARSLWQTYVCDYKDFIHMFLIFLFCGVPPAIKQTLSAKIKLCDY